MNNTNFTNLHNHSLYSWDSASKIDEMVKFVKNDGQKALSLTDHGNMGGIPDLFKSCKKHGILGIAGCEFYITQNDKDSSEKNSTNRKLDHLVVLAKNKNGYKNLLKLCSEANQVHNYYYKPRIDKALLKKYSADLIVINGHIGTSLSDIFFNREGVECCESLEEGKTYLKPDVDEFFIKEAGWFKDIFGDDFYVECQLFDKEDPFQQTLGYCLYDLANKHGFQAVGTGDAHYIRPSDQMAHKTFVGIKQNAKISLMKYSRYLDSGMYGLITNEQAKECYPKDLIEHTQNIVDKIEEYDIEEEFSIPQFWKDPHKLLRDICESQIGIKCPDTKEYRDRLDEELEILKLGNVESYFLLVKDFIDYAESMNILVGAGRGSAGGCLTAYLSNIIKINPIEYGLLFERFISPDRLLAKQLPDIDSDFSASKRDIVLEYIKNKYGHDKVAELITYGTLQGKGALKDVLRVNNACDFSTMNKITDLLPQKDKISDKLADFKDKYGTDSLLLYALITDPDSLSDYCTYDPDTKTFDGQYADYFKIAAQLEGAIKSESKHPCAVIISDKPISESAPIVKDKNGNLLCGYSGGPAESVGLVKYDILGIVGLDKLQTLNELIKTIPIEDYE